MGGGTFPFAFVTNKKSKCKGVRCEHRRSEGSDSLRDDSAWQRKTRSPHFGPPGNLSDLIPPNPLLNTEGRVNQVETRLGERSLWSAGPDAPSMQLELIKSTIRATYFAGMSRCPCGINSCMAGSGKTASQGQAPTGVWFTVRFCVAIQHRETLEQCLTNIRLFPFV